MTYKEPHMDRNGAKSFTEALGQVNANMVKGKGGKRPAAKKPAAKKPSK